jgi:hypothetical protein
VLLDVGSDDNLEVLRHAPQAVDEMRGRIRREGDLNDHALLCFTAATLSIPASNRKVTNTMEVHR